MTRPFFSVVIPTLNEEAFLPKLLHDLQKQTFEQFEVVVVDGKSEDKTAELVQKLAEKDTRFKLISSSIRNVSAQRNLGGTRASAKTLLFLDADVRLPRYFLEGIHYNLLRHTYDGWTAQMRADSSKVSDRLSVNLYQTMNEIALRLKKSFIFGPCIGCKKQVFSKIKGFDQTLKIGEDSDFVQKIITQGMTFMILPDPYFVFSFRRFRKEGLFNTINLTFVLALKTLLNERITEPVPEYPMLGGQYFTLKKKANALDIRKEFAPLFSSMSAVNRKKIGRILDQLKEYVTKQ